ncbi:MAG: tetratricopeptide repeat protein [Candidatus Binatia bacterium]
MGNELGFFPQAKVRIEIAPDVPSFNAISTLSLRDIEETGAVGICKFNKIMTISPRVLMHGYRWLDSLSHEYLHYAIVGLTNNKAPIWLHEGMARFYETRWRHDPPEDREDYLTPANQTLLAQALEKNRFVGFKKMEPSLIQLETPEEVQLAYAEAASAIDFIVHRKGQAGIRELLSEVGKRPTPKAIEKVVGTPFGILETQWKGFLKGKGLKEIEGSRVRKLKVKGNQKEDEEAVELKEIQSVVARNRTHLGDRLWKRGRMIAATAEYQRALQISPYSTIILRKLARILIHRKRYEEALSHLKKAQDLDPDHVGTYIQLGRLYHARKKYSDARVVLEEAIQINPFHPTIYRLLYEIYAALGEQDPAKKSKATLDRLMAPR